MVIAASCIYIALGFYKQPRPKSLCDSKNRFVPAESSGYMHNIFILHECAGRSEPLLLAYALAMILRITAQFYA